MPNPTTVSGEVERVARAMQNAELSDGEGNTYRLFDLLDFSGENKAVTITRQLAEAALQALCVEPPSDVAPECIKQLRDHQQQLDPHGEMVGVPRQALDETFDFIISLQRQIAERDEALREARGFITERGKLDLDWDAVAETSDILAKLSALIGNGEVSDGQP
jgi:hypothetical protein